MLMDFERLWAFTQTTPYLTRGQELTSTSPLRLNIVNYLADAESPAASTPVLDFDLTAIHAMQGSSVKQFFIKSPLCTVKDPQFGLGMLDLLPRNISQVTRGVRPHILSCLNKVTVHISGVSADGFWVDRKDCGGSRRNVTSAWNRLELEQKRPSCLASTSSVMRVSRSGFKKNDTCPVCRYKFPDHQTYLTSQNS